MGSDVGIISAADPDQENDQGLSTLQFEITLEEAQDLAIDAIVASSQSFSSYNNLIENIKVWDANVGHDVNVDHNVNVTGKVND